MQDGQKKRPSPPVKDGLVADALICWRNAKPFIEREELAVICNRSVSTIDRWMRGVGEPTFSDIWLMESHRRGLVRALFDGVSVRRKAARS